jgi:uncharacterized protein YndB with AHSA1/START domain
VSDRSVTHATFTIERVYAASPGAVFAAWADPALKARWFSGPGAQHELDFRVGGRELNRDGPRGGPLYTFDARFAEIVPEERIVYTYEMYADEALASVSLATVELGPDGHGTRLRLTEQAAFLDERDVREVRERGTRGLLDRLGEEVETTP